MPELEEIGIEHFEGDGDFRSAESIDLLKEADIVVTNPPFSLFREYVAQLMEYEKKFIIVGPTNAITYKELFLHQTRHSTRCCQRRHAPQAGPSLPEVQASARVPS